jgi:hypothetical protein
MPDAPTSPPPPTDAEIAAILATAPFEYDTFRVSPADSDFRQIVTIASGWPSPDCRSWGMRPDRWQAHSLLLPVQVLDPDFEIGGCVDLEHWSKPVQDLVRQIPEQVREALRPFPTPQQWYLQRVLARVPEFLTLVVDEPAVAGLLATKLYPLGDVVPKGLERLKPLLRGPRRRLLGLMGLPEERWVLRVLRKLDLDALIDPGPPIIDPLLCADHKFIRRSLQHLPRLRGDTLKIIADTGCWPMVSYSLLADDDEDDIWQERSLHDLLIELHVAREDGRAAKKPASFRTRKQVLAAWEAIEPWDPVAEFTSPFEAPTGPVELRLRGEPAIKLMPLLSAQEVFEHGKAQLNCLAADREYYEDASTGYTALYAVAWHLPGDGEEQVATLSVKQRWDADWEVLQLLGPENDLVPEWLAARVGDWLKEVNAAGDCDIDSPPPTWLTGREDDEGLEQLVLPFAPRLPTPLEVPTWV